MRILLTGGAGFIGSHVAGDLLRRGHQVLVLDNLSTGRRENVPPGAVLQVADLRDRLAVGDIVAAFRPHAVSHHAAQASVARSVAAPAEDMEINVIGSLHLLEACREVGVRRFVFASTGGALYGNVPEPERAATTWPSRPASPYALSKATFEGLLALLAPSFGLSHSILRYGNVYGPRQDPYGEAGVVAIFCQRLLARQPLCLYGRRQAGDRGCVRDYVDVRDVVSAHAMALEGEVSEPVLHVATGTGTATADLLELLEEITGERAIRQGAPPRPGDVERSVLEPAPGLPPPRPLRVGLEATVAWFRGRGRPS